MFLLFRLKLQAHYLLSVERHLSSVAHPGPCLWRTECEKIWRSGGLASGKFLGATPFRRSENEGNALFSYILHHKHDYIENKRQHVLLNFDQEFILIIVSYSTKAKEEFLFSYKRSNISSTKKGNGSSQGSQLNCKMI